MIEAKVIDKISKAAKCAHCEQTINKFVSVVRVSKLSYHINCYETFAPVPWSPETLVNQPWLTDPRAGIPVTMR